MKCYTARRHGPSVEVSFPQEEEKYCYNSPLPSGNIVVKKSPRNLPEKNHENVSVSKFIGESVPYCLTPGLRKPRKSMGNIRVANYLRLYVEPEQNGLNISTCGRSPIATSKNLTPLRSKKITVISPTGASPINTTIGFNELHKARFDNAELRLMLEKHNKGLKSMKREYTKEKEKYKRIKEGSGNIKRIIQAKCDEKLRIRAEYVKQQMLINGKFYIVTIDLDRKQGAVQDELADMLETANFLENIVHTIAKSKKFKELVKGLL